jgi:hypothetical protein
MIFSIIFFLILRVNDKKYFILKNQLFKENTVGGIDNRTILFKENNITIQYINTIFKKKEILNILTNKNISDNIKLDYIKKYNILEENDTSRNKYLKDW